MILYVVINMETGNFYGILLIKNTTFWICCFTRFKTSKKIIYQGINQQDNDESFGRPWDRLRVFNVIQYCNIYIHTHYLV